MYADLIEVRSADLVRDFDGRHFFSTFLNRKQAMETKLACGGMRFLASDKTRVEKPLRVPLKECLLLQNLYLAHQMVGSYGLISQI